VSVKPHKPGRARFLVEFSPGEAAHEDIRLLSERCRQACERLAERGTPVRFLRSVFVPEDGRCLLVYEAGSAEAVVDAVISADLGAKRVIEAIHLEAS
jgi:hypothetical protein